MAALLLVDIQNDFLPGGALAVQDGDLILPVINKLINHAFKLIIATKDWHPANHGSFANSHGKKMSEVINLNGLEQVLWPIHCVQETQGAEFSEKWNHYKVHKIFCKGTDKDIDSYSAFFDNGHRKSTGLHEFLQSNGIKDIYIAGLATDYCVKYSVLDALKLNYRVFVIIDGCKPVNLKPNDEEIAFQEMLQEGAQLIYSSEIISN